MFSVSRLLLTTLLVVFLRLLTLAEAAAYPHFPSEADRSDVAARFDSPAAAEPGPSVRGSFEPDYFDFTAKALRLSTGPSLLEEAEKTLFDTRSPLPQPHPGAASAGSLAAPLQSVHEQALTWQGILPPQLNHPPYYATAPPHPR